MNLQLNNRPLPLSPELIAYNKWRKTFQELAQKAAAKFETAYTTNRDMDMVVKNMEDQAGTCVLPVVEYCITYLVQHGVLTLDLEHFVEMNPFILDPVFEACEEIEEKYLDIVEDERAKNEYRTARRQNRGRWRGGGFGVSGALSGAAKAGAMNMATGALHGTFNIIGSIGSSIKASSQKSKLFRDENTRLSLNRAVFQAAFACHVALINTLATYAGDREAADGRPTPEAVRQAQAMLENADRIPAEDQRVQVLTQALLLNPYANAWYIYMLKRYGDRNGDLDALADYFGVSVIRVQKERLLREFVKQFPLNTEGEALLAQREAQAYKKEIRFSGRIPELDVIEDAVTRFDEAYRTVDGMLVETREAADFCRRELSGIHTILDTIDHESLTSIKQAISVLEGYHSPISEKYKQQLSEEQRSLIEQRKTVDVRIPGHPPLLCETIDEAEELKKVVPDLAQALHVHSQQGEEALKQLCTQLEQGDTPQKLADVFLREIHRRLEKIDVDLRTAYGQLYATRELAQDARAQFDSLKEQIQQEEVKTKADQIRVQIDQSSLSEEAKESMKTELFQRENEKELRTIGTMKKLGIWLLLGLIVVSYLFNLSSTPEFFTKRVEVLNVPLLLESRYPVESLTYFDGLKNGIVVFGRSIGDVLVAGFHDYIGGFGDGLLGNIIWAVLGIFWVIIVQCIAVIPRYLVTLVMTFLQKGSITYHIGYIVGSAIPLAVAQLVPSEEDGDEENVKKLKGWTTGKLTRLIFMIILAFALTIICVRLGI